MAESEALPRWRPTPTTLVAGTIVLLGFWLSSLSWWFFVLVGLGAFGPGVLRELGLLDDKDELQRSADRRAGYHAFLVAGLVATILVAYVRSGAELVHAEELATLFLSLLWFTWFLSSMLTFWGAQRGAAWLLRVFGIAVLTFTILANVGSEWTGWAALLLHPLLALPFFALAWLAGRWPRLAGALLLVVAAGFTHLFFGSSSFAPVDQAVTFVLFVGPLLGASIALLSAQRE